MEDGNIFVFESLKIAFGSQDNYRKSGIFFYSKVIMEIKLS